MIKRFFGLFICAVILLSGCNKATSGFKSNYSEFMDSYIAATDFLENGNDSLKELKDLDEDFLESQLNKMKKAIENMGEDLSSDNTKGLFCNVTMFYEGLEFLLYAKKNYDTLSIEEKRRAYAEADIILLNRESIKNGDI